MKGLLVSVVITATVLVATKPSTASIEGLDKAMVDRGKYLIQVSGCNDCHTAGYTFVDGETPVSEWLKGDNFGWSGPWGTTYGSNLRLFVQDMTDLQWVVAARSLRRAPPMPWFNLNAMNDDDLLAIYHFIRSLGEPGDPAPAALPPGAQPQTPFAQFSAP